MKEFEKLTSYMINLATYYVYHYESLLDLISEIPILKLRFPLFRPSYRYTRKQIRKLKTKVSQWVLPPLGNEYRIQILK